MRAVNGSTDHRPRARLRAAVATTAALAAVAAVAGCDSLRDTTHDGRAGAGPSASAGPRWNPRPASIASLGDSISRGFDACSALSDCPEVSWATGSQPQSLAGRLLSDPLDNSWNYARTGARIADLPDQVRSAAARKPELVTVLIGANDACRPSVDAMTSAEDFRAGFAASVRELRGALPKAQLYVASVPDLKRLWSQGRESPYAKTVWKLGICQSMLRDADAVDTAARQRREQVSQRVAAYNDALRDVCGKDALCRFDDAVHGYEFTGEQLSKWDWFHPNKEGQNALAELAYRRITTG
ncbi:SGNH/GDSL hydrolase family protein [Streptomyces gamaensis]|uniref:SGNH/GDSL hydrolase family protein n=1 Tax=Streptomyces gamaensis TaxID=1763542 RepID=A0ABW0YZ59_9ACTN